LQVCVAIAVRLPQPLAGRAPDHVASIVRHQYGAVGFDRHPDRSSIGNTPIRCEGPPSKYRAAATPGARSRTARGQPGSRSAWCDSGSRAARGRSIPHCAMPVGAPEMYDIDRPRSLETRYDLTPCRSSGEAHSRRGLRATACRFDDFCPVSAIAVAACLTTVASIPIQRLVLGPPDFYRPPRGHDGDLALECRLCDPRYSPLYIASVV
jgi:hypothetical protein